MNKNSSYFRPIFIFFLGIVFMFLIGYFYPNIFVKSGTKITPLRESTLGNSDKYEFIDPLLGINRPDSATSPEFSGLKKNITEYIDNETKKNNLQTISIYLRSAGDGFVVNPNNKFGLASLIKVPIMITYFKLAEKDPNILNKRIKYSGEKDYNAQKSIDSSTKIEKGKTYTVSELIDYMIKYSDNNAYDILATNLNITDNYEYANELFNDLGISEISLDKEYMDVKSYSLFFRVLYNSTYLSREMSERAMKILSETDFDQGISAGVPGNIKISQKFGEATVKSSDGTILAKELHNCGIIYHPNEPYLLCIMTKGGDLNNLEKIISTISKMVYDYTDKYVYK